MNSLLVKYKPNDATTEEWTKHWEGAGYTLEPLAKVLLEFLNSRRAFKESDFQDSSSVNAVIFKAGEASMAQKILDLLPSSAKIPV